ncbi:hypothetical protein P7K49_032283, partial [Saguinus oedipus]
MQLGPGQKAVRAAATDLFLRPLWVWSRVVSRRPEADGNCEERSCRTPRAEGKGTVTGKLTQKSKWAGSSLGEDSRGLSMSPGGPSGQVSGCAQPVLKTVTNLKTSGPRPAQTDCAGGLVKLAPSHVCADSN